MLMVTAVAAYALMTEWYKHQMPGYSRVHIECVFALQQAAAFQGDIHSITPWLKVLLLFTYFESLTCGCRETKRMPNPRRWLLSMQSADRVLLQCVVAVAGV
jgi:hypothetical protein